MGGKKTPIPTEMVDPKKTQNGPNDHRRAMSPGPSGPRKATTAKSEPAKSAKASPTRSESAPSESESSAAGQSASADAGLNSVFASFKAAVENALGKMELLYLSFFWWF